MHLDPEEAILAPVSSPAIATNPVFSSEKKQAMISLKGMAEKSLGLLVIRVSHGESVTYIDRVSYFS